MTQYDVFISYAKEDLKYSEKIYRDLIDCGITAWIDFDYISPGQNWRIEILKAIRSSKYFLSIISKNSISKKGFVQKELKIALDILDEFPNSEIYIIPVRIDTSQPLSEKLEEIHWINLFESYQKGLNKIIELLGTDKSKQLTIITREEIVKFSFYTNFAIGTLSPDGIFCPKEILNIATDQFKSILNKLNIQFEDSLDWNYPATIQKAQMLILDQFDKIDKEINEWYSIVALALLIILSKIKDTSKLPDDIGASAIPDNLLRGLRNKLIKVGLQLNDISYIIDKLEKILVNDNNEEVSKSFYEIYETFLAIAEKRDQISE